MAISFASCHLTVKDKKHFEGNYSGKIPCADCPSIEVKLALKPDSSFILRNHYAERDVEDFIEGGKWQVIGDTLILTGQTNQTVVKYFISGDTLFILDENAKRMNDELKGWFELVRS